jgi:hypothetical protein
MLEAVAGPDTWFWHAYFGIPGSNNDINVLNQSPIFAHVERGEQPSVEYQVNGHTYTTPYYLTDGIYPSWASFVKSIPVPQLPKHVLYAQKQEAARKDVERAFGILQARFHIVTRPARTWDERKMAMTIRACIILHNMIVHDERDTYKGYIQPLYSDDDVTPVQQGPLPDYDLIQERSDRIENRHVHLMLKNDLIEHIWELFSTHDVVGEEDAD